MQALRCQVLQSVRYIAANNGPYSSRKATFLSMALIRLDSNSPSTCCPRFMKAAMASHLLRSPCILENYCFEEVPYDARPSRLLTSSICQTEITPIDVYRLTTGGFCAHLILATSRYQNNIPKFRVNSRLLKVRLKIWDK